MGSQVFVGIGALSGFIAVAAGAFGAHGLKSRLSPELLAIFETAARYQMYHALLLILVGLLAGRDRSAALTASAGFLIAGTVLFSGSLYALALTGHRILGAITPLGGLGFLLGWLLLAYFALLAR
jgi:uncharacterized membrane protein YgdD (TMEM256/DUF423 family)